MKNQVFVCLLTLSAGLIPTKTVAQLSSNPDKFLGNITTRYQVDYGKEKYYTLWNQITPENESKWGSVEGTKGSYNWGCDNAFNYAKQHKFTYKFHALVWGAQYPDRWFNSNMSIKDRYAAIVKWFDAVKKKYPTLPMIDVVNEAVGMHQQGNPLMKESLGGGGKTGYDWLIKAFELAHERWPDAILIYNDYNTFQWDTDNYIDLVRTLRDAGAPIDAYGCQSHDLTDCSLSKFKSSETKIQNALKMPMYSTEYDIGTDDDNLQLQRYKEQIPYMWEKDYCAGITLWGYIYGATWTTNGNSGIIKDGKDRPAMTWLREYMQSDAAKNAKSPYPGGWMVMLVKERDYRPALLTYYMPCVCVHVCMRVCVPVDMALDRTHFQSPFVSKKQSTMIPSHEGYEQAWDWSWTVWAMAAGKDGCRFGALFPLNNLSPDRDKQSLEEQA